MHKSFSELGGMTDRNREDLSVNPDNVVQDIPGGQVKLGSGDNQDRACDQCFIDQIVRSKHCEECRSCVALYDHHCYWLGTCIGQTNRVYLWVYLLSQFLLINCSLMVLMGSINYQEDKLNFMRYNGLKVLFVACMGILDIGVTLMLLFHSFLALTNQTTYEVLEREEVGYLQDWHKVLSGPFSRGLIRNLAYFFYYGNKERFTNWTL